MKRFTKISVGLLCIVVSIWPGYLAAVFFYDIWPALSGSATIHDSYFVVFFEKYHLQGWLIYAVPVGLAVFALALLGAGMWLLLSRNDSAA